MSWSLGVVCDDMRVLLEAWRALAPLLPPSDHLRLLAQPDLRLEAAGVSGHARLPYLPGLAAHPAWPALARRLAGPPRQVLDARRTHLDDGRPIWILRLGHPAAWVGCVVRDLPFSSPRPYLLHATRVPDSHADGRDLRA
jgi:hypothetical protein